MALTRRRRLLQEIFCKSHRAASRLGFRVQDNNYRARMSRKKMRHGSRLQKAKAFFWFKYYAGKAKLQSWVKLPLEGIRFVSGRMLVRKRKKKMTSKPNFNVAADKVVNLVEWKLKARVLCFKELSFKDNLLATFVDSPASAVVATVKVIRGIFNKKSKVGGMYGAAPFGLYVSGAGAEGMMQAVGGAIRNKTRKEKIYHLCQKAFEQSADVRAKPVVQRLKTLNL